MTNILSQNEVDELMREAKESGGFDTPNLATTKIKNMDPLGITDAKVKDHDRAEVLRCPYKYNLKKAKRCPGYKADVWYFPCCWYYVENCDACLHKLYNRKLYQEL